MSRFTRTPLISASILAVASLGFSGAPERAAAGNDFVKGLIVGGSVAAIISEANKSKRKKTTKQRSTTQRSTTGKTKRAPSGPRVTIATFATTRDQVRDYQTRLNTLGYDAGLPDGLMGPRTRAAVRAFQASLGNPQTGRLTPNEAGALNQRSASLSTAAVPGSTAPPAPQPVFPALAGQSQAQAGAAPAPASAAPGQAQAAATPTPAFPALPGQAAPAPAAPAAPGQTLAGAAPAPAPAFPAVAAPGTAPASTAPAPAFPALPGQSATVPAAEPAQPTFPQLTLPGAGSDDAMAQAGGQAAPGVTPKAAPTGALPVVAAALANVAGMASGATAKPAPVPAPEPEHFAILGVETGAGFDDARQTLGLEGLQNCQQDGDLMHCSGSTPAVQDLVALRSVEMPDGSTRVGAINRHLSFATPLARTQLEAMMAEKYAPLLAASDHMIGSENCLQLASIKSESRAALTERIMSGGTDALVGLARNCDRFARIVFDEADQNGNVAQVGIFLFDGEIFAHSVAAQTPKIKF